MHHHNCILKQLVHLYNRNKLHNIMLTCIILHNMIVKDDMEDNLDLNEASSIVIIEDMELSLDQYVWFRSVLEKRQ
jgi:hypothetical protein